MNTETKTIDGYTVLIAQDEHAENPFEAWDCEMPLLVYSCDHSGRLDTYHDAPSTWHEFVALLPDSAFARGKRLELIKELQSTLKDYAEFKKYYGYSDRDAFAESLKEDLGEKPEDWRNATAWLEMAEWLLDRAGITYHSTESHGYSQGDTVKLLAIALPEWVKLVGAPEESLKSQCEGACDLYGAWAWGDVYGISSIYPPVECQYCGESLHKHKGSWVDETEGDCCSGNDEGENENEPHVPELENPEDGEEIEDGNVWGFYGRDHEKSGLLESARDSIRYHKEKTAKERKERQEANLRESLERFEMACRDTVTLP